MCGVDERSDLLLREFTLDILTQACYMRSVHNNLNDDGSQIESWFHRFMSLSSKFVAWIRRIREKLISLHSDCFLLRHSNCSEIILNNKTKVFTNLFCGRQSTVLTCVLSYHNNENGNFHKCSREHVVNNTLFSIFLYHFTCLLLKCLHQHAMFTVNIIFGAHVCDSMYERLFYKEKDFQFGLHFRPLLGICVKIMICCA